MKRKRNLLVRVISAMANLTPNTVYFPKGWPETVNDVADKVESEKGGNKSALTNSAISVACAASVYMKEGDEANFQMTSVSFGGKDVGDYDVTIKRLRVSE